MLENFDVGERPAALLEINDDAKQSSRSSPAGKMVGGHLWSKAEFAPPFGISRQFEAFFPLFRLR